MRLPFDATIQDAGIDTGLTTHDAAPADAGSDAADSPDAASEDASTGCVLPANAWTATVPSPPLPPEMAPDADSILTVPLLANDLIYDPYSQLLYVATQSDAGANSNSIVRIDPTTGTIVGAVAIDGEAFNLAESADGQFIYAGLRITGTVVR